MMYSLKPGVFYNIAVAATKKINTLERAYATIVLYRDFTMDKGGLLPKNTYTAL